MRLAAGLHPDPLGELTALPRLPSWIHGVLFLKGTEGMRPMLYPDLGGIEARACWPRRRVKSRYCVNGRGQRLRSAGEAVSGAQT